MSKSTLPADKQAQLNARAAEILGLADVHIDTVNARPIAFAEVDAAMEASAGEPFEFDGYIIDEAGFLRQCRFRVRKSRKPNEPFEAHFAPIPNPRPNGPDMVADRDHVVGHSIRLDVLTPDGPGADDVLLYTSAEAEESATVLTGHTRVGADAARVYIADGSASLMPLVPFYGSQATMSFIVADASPEEVAERAQRALEAEFGDALGKNRKVLTRRVANRRVNVYSTQDDTALAIGILAAEVSLVMDRFGTGVRTESHRSGGDVIIGS